MNLSYLFSITRLTLPYLDILFKFSHRTTWNTKDTLVPYHWHELSWSYVVSFWNLPLTCLDMVLRGILALWTHQCHALAWSYMGLLPYSNLSMPCLDMVLHDFLALETLPTAMPWHGLTWYPWTLMSWHLYPTHS